MNESLLKMKGPAPQWGQGRGRQDCHRASLIWRNRPAPQPLEDGLHAEYLHDRHQGSSAAITVGQVNNTCAKTHI